MIPHITVRATSDALVSHAESVLTDAVLHNPNLGGMRFEVVRGDYDCVEMQDEIEATILYRSIFRCDPPGYSPPAIDDNDGVGREI